MKSQKTSALVLLLSAVTIWVFGAEVTNAQTLPGVGAVMTYNVNEGSDFLQVQSANSVGDFLVGVGQIVQQVEGTKPPERMQAVARQILAIRPQLVSLNVPFWASGPCGLKSEQSRCIDSKALP